MPAADKPHVHAHDHDHAHLHAPTDLKGALQAAETACSAKGAKLTAARREIFSLLAASHTPLGAYEIIDRLAATGSKRLAPISVYRVLDFLKENGLIHRIESRNAYVVCGHGDHAGAPVVFLICECCGAATEVEGPALDGAVKALAARAGFAPRAAVIELHGTCKCCHG